jgi:hypothetical protein
VSSPIVGWERHCRIAARRSPGKGNMRPVKRRFLVTDWSRTPTSWMTLTFPGTHPASLFRALKVPEVVRPRLTSLAVRQLKIGRSAVRPRPWPPLKPLVRLPLNSGFVIMVSYFPVARLTGSDRDIARLAKSDRTSYRTELRSESSCARDVQGRATWGRPPCSRTFADSTATYPQDTFAQVRAAAECLGGRLIHVSLDTPAGYMRAPGAADVTQLTEPCR